MKTRHYAPPAYGQEFEAWWKEYPRRRRVAKPACWAKWARLDRDGKLPAIATLLSVLRAQKLGHQWTKDGGEYVPLPLTYLNQGRWEDESVAPPEPAPEPPPEPLRIHQNGGGAALQEAIEEAIGLPEWRTWFRPCALRREGDQLIIAAPNDRFTRTIESSFLPFLHGVLAAHGVTNVLLVAHR